MDFPLTSLYLNSLLANLNAREHIRGALPDVEYIESYHLSGRRTGAMRGNSEGTGGTVRG